MQCIKLLLQLLQLTRSDYFCYFTVNTYFVYTMALINSIVKYRDLSVSGTVKIWCAVYRDTEKTAHP